MSETLMTEANQPNEGGASQTPNEASTDVEEGMQQEAVVEQNQEAQDEATAGKEESDTPEDGAPGNLMLKYCKHIRKLPKTLICHKRMHRKFWTRSRLLSRLGKLKF